MNWTRNVARIANKQTKPVVIVAIICVTALELAAIKAGINGELYILSLTVIGGLGGFAVGKRS